MANGEKGGNGANQTNGATQINVLVEIDDVDVDMVIGDYSCYCYYFKDDFSQ